MQLRNFGAVLSIIGYGVHYNERFLAELMAQNGHRGVYRHISEIEDFAEGVRAIREVMVDTSLTNLFLRIKTNTGIPVQRIYKTTPEVALVGLDGEALIDGSFQGKVTLYVESPVPCDGLEVELEVGRMPPFFKKAPGFSLSAEQPFSPESAADFVRTIAIYAYSTGDREIASELFRKTGDENFADQAAYSFTTREQRETASTFRSYFRDRKFIGQRLKPVGPSHNALNVLRTLIEDPENVVYLPQGAYQRSGVLTRDPRVLESPLGSTLRVMGYVSHESRFNFSVRCLKDVKVIPEHGGTPEDKKIWRTYNIILDGNLHTPELMATLSEPSFRMLEEAGVIESGSVYSATSAYTLNLRNLKMVSPVWANPATLGLVNLLKEEAELEAEQTALNRHIKIISSETSGPSSEDSDMYTEKAEAVEGVEFEYYSAPCVEIRLMGYKVQSYNCLHMNYEKANARVREVRQRLIVVRFLIRAMTFAMEVTSSKTIHWDSGKYVQRGKYEKLEQTAVFHGANLKKVSWTEECVCS